MPRHFFLLLAAIFSLSVILRGAPAPTPMSNLSNATLARETSDPTSSLWMLFTELSSDLTPSRSFRTSNQFTLELQPSLPLLLTPSLRLLNIPDLTLASEGTARGHQVNGLQSFSWFSALGPVSGAQGFAWGVGPYASFPVSTDEDLAASQWQFGGGGVLSWRGPDLVASVLVRSGWTTSDQGKEAGSLQIQYNLQRFFGDGFQVGLGRPRIEYTWDRRGIGGWTIPVGVDVAQIFHLGPLPIKVMLEYDFAVLNDSRWEPEHIIRLTFIPVLRDPIPDPLIE